ncbi:ogr/Delta-like zinc finger family protein [Klebsiella michiganensis]|uniref:ogr/Delta-like zinc finger family protein n=1 Tax=Klebsiella michiganensis TaxID=1134687 RepID=UPI0011E839A2|nr:ogr/Delta-like zinc finger family protein [Klebsiella michiganensis]TXV04722.1 transcriptional regulator [Klebsiella michiganensis]HDS8139840.1 ogr/Delta-like zinc finger family protein [Klebsiella michiganensis]HDT1978192.1 ogr/Delta-like zinc finger family protein [Klebsiella michiganensis]HDV9732945.1 ogr/Delta-like zinc finger family protein [Klebsiella michiganensis]HDV9800169.1 ogr/Delta-like zinc finger family protein [Klebsiella michiganensis]
MMICPLCGSAAHTRSSFQVSSMTKERYNQCQNINCSHTFVTHESFVRSISTPKEVHPEQPHPTNSGQAVRLSPLCRNGLKREFTTQ